MLFIAFIIIIIIIIDNNLIRDAVLSDLREYELSFEGIKNDYNHSDSPASNNRPHTSPNIKHHDASPIRLSSPMQKLVTRPCSNSNNSPSGFRNNTSSSPGKQPFTPPLNRASLVSSRLKKAIPVDDDNNSNSNNNDIINNYTNDKLLNELIDLRIKSSAFYKSIISKTTKKEHEYRAVIEDQEAEIKKLKVLNVTLRMQAEGKKVLEDFVNNPHYGNGSNDTNDDTSLNTKMDDDGIENTNREFRYLKIPPSESIESIVEGAIGLKDEDENNEIHSVLNQKYKNFCILLAKELQKERNATMNREMADFKISMELQERCAQLSKKLGEKEVLINELKKQLHNHTIKQSLTNTIGFM
jgi:hypothetical protein